MNIERFAVESEVAALLLRRGDLAGARQKLNEALRRDPFDTRARMFLFQLHCIDAAWEKAMGQLHALARLDGEARMMAFAYGRLIEAERTREATLSPGGGRAPLLVPSPPWAEDFVAAVEAELNGEAHQAQVLRERALEICPDSPGQADGRAIAHIYDPDHRFGPLLEIVVGGRWSLAPFALIETLMIEPPCDLRDQVWAPATVRLRDGAAFAGFVPARYPVSRDRSDPNEKLGRTTTWTDTACGLRGQGQRIWAFADHTEVSVLSLRRLTLTTPAPVHQEA